MAGRPTKATPETIATICRALENGATRRAAAAIGGIREQTYYEWVRENPAFAEAVEQARAKFVEKAGLIAHQHPGSMLKLAMMLNRDDPDLQPVEEKTAVTAKVDYQLTVKIEKPDATDADA